MKQRLLPFLLLISFIACEESVPVIKPINFDQYRLKAKQGAITKKRADQHAKMLDDLIRKQTENYAVPKVELNQLEGSNIMLSSLIEDQKSILLFSSSNCGACHLAYFENFPLIIDSLKSLKKSHNIIPIVVKYDWDYTQTDRFEKHLEGFKDRYAEVYIMPDSLSQKFNISGYPVQLFLDERSVVRKYEIGASFDIYRKKMQDVIAFFDS